MAKRKPSRLAPPPGRGGQPLPEGSHRASAVPPGTPGSGRRARGPGQAVDQRVAPGVRKIRLPTRPAAEALLVLRAFLGVTFVFAGLQKLADHAFFEAGAPGSIQSQLAAAARTSPVHPLVALAQHAPVAFGVVIALAELAVGLGTLFGLWARLAATGGLVLSLLFFLTISFHTWPYYYGSDIVFVFAWTPFVVAGAGPLSVDRALADGGVSRPARAGSGRGGVTSRRLVLQQAKVAGLVALLGAVMAAVAGALGRMSSARSPATPVLGPGGSGTPVPGSGSQGPSSGQGGSVASGTLIGPASKVPVGGAAQFTDPSTGEPALVVQLEAGTFEAFSRVCTHAGCLVDFEQAQKVFFCPCHGSVFDAATGQVLQGPAVAPLPSIPVHEGSDGNLYAEA